MGNGTPLGRVRGLGSAKSGTHHWLLQRFTAAGNILLVLWFLFSLTQFAGFDYDSLRGWIGQPLVAVPLMLMVVSVFWHFRIGLQVLIEDYVHDEGLKFAALALLNFYVFGGGALAVFSIAKIAFAGGAA